MQINEATFDLVRKWEGFKARAYYCPANVLTIGFGTTNRAQLPGVRITEGMEITRAQGEEWLRMGLEKFGASIRPLITAPINENEFGAFVSLAYNIGVGGFRGSSALRHFNAGDKAKAAAAIKLWNKATVNGKRQVLRGLVNRREEEVALFLRPVVSQPLASKPVVDHKDPIRERQNPVVNRQPAPSANPIAALFAAFAALFKRNDK
jgi:lysozyme